MQRRFMLSAAALVAALAVNTAFAQTTLRVFSGGANQRPDLMRKLFDQYQAQNPTVKIEIETGGATSELQRQYLSTVLNAKDPAIDIYLIDSGLCVGFGSALFPAFQCAHVGTQAIGEHRAR